MKSIPTWTFLTISKLYYTTAKCRVINNVLPESNSSIKIAMTSQFA